MIQTCEMRYGISRLSVVEDNESKLARYIPGYTPQVFPNDMDYT